MIVLAETSYRAESCPALSCVHGPSGVRAATSQVGPHGAVRCVTGNLKTAGVPCLLWNRKLQLKGAKSQ